MDSEPFFSFSLDDYKTDWSKVASFLSKFSREAFNAETLITDAENSRYRQAMIDKFVCVLRSPAEDEAFMKWFTADIYTGKRTSAVMNRMGDLAKEAVEPALLRVMGDDFVDKLKEKIRAARDPEVETNITEPETGAVRLSADERSSALNDDRKKAIITTDEERRFHAIVTEICVKKGFEKERILLRDTVNYCNTSIDKPTKWFLRFFNDSKRKNIVSPIPLELAKKLAPEFEVEESPATFGSSRIYIESVEQIVQLELIVHKSLELSLSNQ